MEPSLTGPRAKLARAYEHLEALDHEAAEWFETQPYEIVGHFDSETSEQVFRINIKAGPPARLGVILGDFAQNLRASLDHLVWQLVLLNGKQPNRKVRFPIYRSAAEAAGDTGKPLDLLSPKHRAAVESLQPHEAGDRMEDHGVLILAWLSNTDKHRVVHPTFGFLMPPPWANLKFEGNADAGVLGRTLIANGRRMKDGTEIARVRLYPVGTNPQVEMYGSPVFEVAFGDRWLRAARLEVLYKLTERFIDSFAPDFP